MEAAAKTVEVLSKRILPEKPHHLSFSPTWRHRPLPEDDDVADARGAKRRFEEWHNTRLQYLTFLSEADRGTLLTRSYYDMREEPSKPVPREVSALSKGATTAEKKKLSLSDYKNKKTGIVPSASPPEPAIAKRNEAERAAPPPTSSATSTSTPTMPHADGGKPHQEPRRSDSLTTRTRDLESSSASAKPKPNRDGIAPESRLPPKPASLPPRPPSPAGKRRMPDADDDRPPKRSRPDDRRLAEDRFQRDRDDVPRRKDKIPPSSRDRDHRDVAGVSSSKDERGVPPSSSSLPNGKSLLKGATNPDRNTSRTGRSRGDSVNGVRPNAAAHNSSRGTPTKADGASAKSFVPPLLSPLHLSFDSREREKRLRAEEEDAKARKDRERKRRDDADEGSASFRSKRLDPTVPVAKKPRPPAVIPPLLSPTLPPAVEAELRRRKKSTSDSSDERPRDGRDVLGMKKRPAANGGDVDDHVKLVPAPASKLGHRRRLVVMLDVPKNLRPSFARIVGHAPAHRKDSQSQSERELDRKPRAGSDDAAQQPPARKRPMGSAEGLSAAEATAMKRPRSSDMAGHPKLGTPLTPSKRTTAMSRVSSTTSVAQTPTELVNSTPSASATVDRRPNGGSEVVVAVKGEKPEARIVREKEERLMIVGKNLKHDADLIMKKYRGDSALSMRDRPGESKVKLGYVLSLESIMAFMMGFHAQNVYRGMYNKIGDTTGWNSMFPLMDFLEIEMRRADVTNYQPLYAMLLLLYGVSIDEIVKCYVYHDNLASPTVMENLAKQERRKCRMWLQVREANAAVRNPRLRVDVHPWSTLDDIVEASLRALRLWCVEEKIDWTQEQTLRENWPVKPSHRR